MSAEALVYPFLFLTVFFESFLLVTLLSEPARVSRKRRASTATPKVAVIVPCWNEESTVGGTVESLLALEYPKEKLSIILVDDGSTDRTHEVMSQFSSHPQITVLHKENGGKHTAVNLGIAHAKGADLIGCLDADSFVEPNALREIIACFEDPKVMAATASMSVHQPRTLLQRMQYVEYLLGNALRHIFSAADSIYVTPGPFSFYRPQVFEVLGPFRHAHLTEDMEMALRMQRAGYRIDNAVRARVYTKAPATLGKLVKQRVRWNTGFLRNVLFDYRDLIGSRRHHALGMVILPFSLISVIFAIGLFGKSVVQYGQELFTCVTKVQTVPLAYTLTPDPSFSLFYIPYSTVVILGIMLMLVVVSLIMIGKRLSETSGPLTVNLVLYVLIYGLVSPLWLIRAVADVARGAATAWR